LEREISRALLLAFGLAARFYRAQTAKWVETQKVERSGASAPGRIDKTACAVEARNLMRATAKRSISRGNPRCKLERRVKGYERLTPVEATTGEKGRNGIPIYAGFSPKATERGVLNFMDGTTILSENLWKPGNAIRDALMDFGP